MSRIKIEKHELCIGVALPWAAYDHQGRVLIEKFETIESVSQLDALVERGIYRDDSATAPPLSDIRDLSNPFEALSHIAFRLGHAFTGLYGGRATIRDELLHTCKDLLALYERAPDAMLGATHLLNKTPYSVWHAIDTALISELLGRGAHLEPLQRLTLSAAALTSNIAMLQLQERMYRQSTAFTPDQQQRVRAHPQRSAEILRYAGIDDARWLTAVLQHHERIDGGGYPRGLHGDAIGVEAKIIGLADYYASLISDRAYRSALSPFDALGDYLPERASQFDPGLVRHLTRELGIYPPGTCVRLQNGETAVVISRARGPGGKPKACSFLSPRDEPYAQPFPRDCAVEEFAIKAHCAREEPVPIDPARLWGYTPTVASP